MPTDTEQLARAVREALLDKKGLDPVVLDVRALSGVTDFYIVATGGSPPHLRALAIEARRRARESGHGKGRVEGTPDSGWIVLDMGDVVAHLFLKETRAFYGIEELWNDAPRLT